MSQLTRHLLRGNLLEKVAVDDLSQVTPVDNKIYIIGGSNINTSASGNTVNVDLDDIITITSATIGTLLISGNTISSTAVNTTMSIGSRVGYMKIDYENINSCAITDSSSNIISTSSMTDGQVVIGSTGSTPVAANLTAGTDITITNGANSITIAATGGGGSGGGMLSWERLDYTGSEQLNYTMEPNKGYITNSSVATPQNYNYCPKKNFNLQLPATEDLTIGDMFWVVNKGIGSVAIRGAADQRYLNVRYFTSSDTVDTQFYNWTSVYFLTPGTDSTVTTAPKKYVYLSSLLLIYVGDVIDRRYVGGSSSDYTYTNVFYVLNSVGNWNPAGGGASTAGCYSP